MKRNRYWVLYKHEMQYEWRLLYCADTGLPTNFYSLTAAKGAAKELSHFSGPTKTRIVCVQTV